MQIYKIYINEKVLILLRSKSVEKYNFPKKSTLILRYTGKNKVLFQAIDTLEKDGPYDTAVIHSEDLNRLKSDVKSLFTIIEAGGGLVLNQKGEGLFIFRRGFWDLPKGKLDPGETRKSAAKREVKEETGVKSLVQEKLLGKTRHVFKTSGGKRVLKLTNWYIMRAPKQKLIPEAREQIEEAVWQDLNYFLDKSKPTFKSVKDVVHMYQNIQNVAVKEKTANKS
jgi:8-oxo-dGTP pyrophosphatase MutT (NUDIX family)